MRDVVVGTAGHIDHGKTLLVKAMTGTDADRWEEEKRRGITLDIGFATLAEERGTLHFVDLPGHERFIKNMLAGATGIDLCILVVAADESVMPQTEEHAEIISLLGVSRGVVALNKVDLVDAEMLEMAQLELGEFLASRGLGHLPVVPVSAATGRGVSDLVSALFAQAALCSEPPQGRPFRLPVDRVFPVKGFGTVVTGTCIDGSLELEGQVQIFPDGGTSRVRGLQVFGKPVEKVRAGQRAALNLTDLRHADLRRGHMAAETGALWPTHLLDVRLKMLESARSAMRSGSTCTLHIHTQEVEAHVHLEGVGALEPGREAIAQLRAHEPLAAWPGDRFVLRLPSPARTVAGGEVLLVAVRKARWRRPVDLRTAEALKSGDGLAGLLAEAGALGVRGEAASARLGLTAATLEEAARAAERAGVLVRLGDGLWWLESGEALAWRERAVAWMKARHEGKTPLAWTPRQEFLGRWQRFLGPEKAEALTRHLVQAGDLEAEGDRLRPPGHEVNLSPAQAKTREAVLGILGGGDFVFRTGKELEAEAGPEVRGVLPLLQASGLVVRFGGDFFTLREALERLRGRLAERAEAGGASIAVPDFKDLLGITRKYAMPLLEYLDDLKWTRREGEGRRILIKADD